jgi:probable HAF family extracellular repeat protein
MRFPQVSFAFRLCFIVGITLPDSFVFSYDYNSQWTFTALGNLVGDSGVARDVSDNGVVVGQSKSSAFGGNLEAFRWSEQEGMIGLGDLPGNQEVSQGRAISKDGKIIVGLSSSGHSEAFRWTAETGMVGLGDLSNTGLLSVAYALSDNGEIIVGTSDEPLGKQQAFLWTSNEGMKGLGFLKGV